MAIERWVADGMLYGQLPAPRVNIAPPADGTLSIAVDEANDGASR